jgi:hypothetical protein
MVLTKSSAVTILPEGCRSCPVVYPKPKRDSKKIKTSTISNIHNFNGLSNNFESDPRAKFGKSICTRFLSVTKYLEVEPVVKIRKMAYRQVVLYSWQKIFHILRNPVQRTAEWFNF